MNLPLKIFSFLPFVKQYWCCFCRLNLVDWFLRVGTEEPSNSSSPSMSSARRAAPAGGCCVLMRVWGGVAAHQLRSRKVTVLEALSYAWPPASLGGWPASTEQQCKRYHYLLATITCSIECERGQGGAICTKTDSQGCNFHGESKDWRGTFD